MALSISRLVLKEELELTRRILSKWADKFNVGIPGEDMPATEQALDDFLRELCGEFTLCASKLEHISNILSDDRNS